MQTIYNTLTKTKEPFVPISGKKVGMYICGLTVYDYAHLGHARVFVCFDVIVRFLKVCGYDVTYVRNITDIEDKIIKRANETGESVEFVTNTYIQKMHDDFAKLLILPPDIEPKATEHIPQIISLISKLIEKGFGYVGEVGDVYFDISKYSDYGMLGRKDLTGQEEGKRIAVSHDKRNPGDFVLWKKAKEGEPKWDSPWGEGRPGWHIECSAMSMHYLSSNFDIHGGGSDLQFPHHDNEIAQSVCATSDKFANSWMHVGYLQINKEKMAKSLNNFVTIQDLLKKYNPETLRYFLLSSHYRSTLNFSHDNIAAANEGLKRLYLALRDLPQKNEPKDDEFKDSFFACMKDDFNTPKALSVLYDLSHQVQKHKKSNKEKAIELSSQLKYLGSILGILTHKVDEFLHFGFSKDEVEQIEQKIEIRKIARKEKDWDKADNIRNELLDLGVDIEDIKFEKTLWHKQT